MDFDPTQFPVDELMLPGFGYDAFLPDMPFSHHHAMAGPSTAMNDDYAMAGPSPATNDHFNAAPSTPESESESPEPRPWKPSLDAPVGQEGETPYKDLNDFETAEEILSPYNDQIDSETLFHSLQESVHWRSMQVVDTKPAYDETIPRDLNKKRACVKLLFKAWKSTASATDNPGMKKPFEEERHDNARVECVCWLLLEALIRRSEMGPLLVAYDPAKTKENPAINSFAMRLDEVVISMREQKTICKHLLDAPYINTFVDDPVRARNRVASNRDLNKRKGDTMSLGKGLLKKASDQGSSRTKGKKRARSPSTDGYISDESSKYSPTPATVKYATPSQPVNSSRTRKPGGGGRSSTQYASTPTSSRGAYGTSGLYSGSLVSLQTNATIPRVSQPASPTPAGPLSRQTMQHSGGQSIVQSPVMIPMDLPQAMFGNYNSMTGQNLPGYMFTPPTMSHSTLFGLGGQFPFTTQPGMLISDAHFAPTSAPQQTLAQHSQQLNNDNGA